MLRSAAEAGFGPACVAAALAHDGWVQCPGGGLSAGGSWPRQWRDATAAVEVGLVEAEALLAVAERDWRLWNSATSAASTALRRS